MDVVHRIKKELDEVRPILQNDGGDIEFIRFEEGIVYVRMQGACSGCSALDFTLYDGIESILIDKVPEVIGIEQEF
jgi:Fe-S cluster biogenesis protein NfuA